MRVSAVIVAAGAGERIGGEPKQFRPLGGRPMLAWSCAAFAGHPAVDAVVVVLPAELADRPPAWLSEFDARIAAGGATRRASVLEGLRALDGTDGVVLVHDAARPFVSADLIARLALEGAAGPVIPTLPLADAIKRMRTRRGDPEDVVETTLDRERLRAAQTPQAFPLELIRRLHEAASADGAEAADDAVLCELAGVSVRTIPGEPEALKVTRPVDLEIAEWLVASGRVSWPGTRGG